MTDCTACKRPTRNDAYGCDDCADELARLFADVPWLVEELDITLTGQRAKRPGAGSRGSTGITWNDAAAKNIHALRAHLVDTVRLCVKDRVRHQSPYVGLPANNPDAMARWLLWRVDGLTLNRGFAHTLRTARRIGDAVLKVIDRPPDRMFLGMCQFAELGLCDGAIYVIVGKAIGKCRQCGTEYDPEERRASLEKALDDRLCTAAEIAELAVYLGLPAGREQVRKLVNQWSKRGRLKPAPGANAAGPRFRYGDVAPLLSVNYETKGA